MTLLARRVGWCLSWSASGDERRVLVAVYAVVYREPVVGAARFDSDGSAVMGTLQEVTGVAESVVRGNVGAVYGFAVRGSAPVDALSGGIRGGFRVAPSSRSLRSLAFSSCVRIGFLAQPKAGHATTDPSSCANALTPCTL